MMQKKKWSDFNPAQRVGVIVLGVIQYALLGAALWDIYHRPEEQIQGKKWTWTALSFVNFLGPLAYFTLGRKKTGG